MYATSKIRSFIIEGIDKKDAYLKGCKRVAKYIASKNYENVLLNVKEIEGNENALEFELLAKVKVGEEQKKFCTICKELHCSFYINEEYNCQRCNLKSFIKRLQKSANIAKGYYKKKMD